MCTVLYTFGPGGLTLLTEDYNRRILPPPPRKRCPGAGLVVDEAVAAVVGHDVRGLPGLRGHLAGRAAQPSAVHNVGVNALSPICCRDLDVTPMSRQDGNVAHENGTGGCSWYGNSDGDCPVPPKGTNPREGPMDPA